MQLDDAGFVHYQGIAGAWPAPFSRSTLGLPPAKTRGAKFGSTSIAATNSHYPTSLLGASYKF